MARDHAGMLADVRLLLEGDDMLSIQVLQTSSNLLTALVCLKRILTLMSVLGNIACECGCD